MNRHLFVLRATVKDGERAFLTRNGRLEQMLVPGGYTLFDIKHELSVELHNVVRALRLEKPIPVYVLYLTAMPGDAGGVHFFPDIYGHDAALTRALGAQERQSAGSIAPEPRGAALPLLQDRAPTNSAIASCVR